MLDRFRLILRHALGRFAHHPLRDVAHVASVELALVVALTAGLALAAPPNQREYARTHLAWVGDELSARGFARLTGSMDSSMLIRASRLDNGLGPADFLRGPQSAPDAPAVAAPEPAILRLQDLNPDQAKAWNAANPVVVTSNPAALPFVLKTSGMLDEARAVDCLTAAIYYEAAWETLDGQRAVAQVVLNRMRHPAYPKTVCGVVFQGSTRTTGCQFSFTCDGSMNRAPNEAAWSRARQVAVAALNGYVMRKVGNATHYHADYVAPYWSPTLLKVTTIGAHVFYRWTGGWGLPGAFGGHYAGDEIEGMQISALDKYATGPTVEPIAGQAPTDDDPLLIELAAPPRGAKVAANATAEGKAAAGVVSDADAAPAPLVTAADLAKQSESMVKADELNWMGKPKDNGPPRIAAPTRGMF